MNCYRSFLPGVLLTVALVSGCAHDPLSSANRASIASVSVNPHVPSPQDINYSGPTQAAGGAFGILGVLATQGAAAGPKDQLRQTLTQNNIDISHIVADEFTKQLQEAQLFSNILPEGANAEFKLEVKEYALISMGISGVLYPYLKVSAQLARSDGSVVWKKVDWVSPLNKANTGGHKLEEFLSHPVLLRDTFQNAGRIVAKALINNMQESSR